MRFRLPLAVALALITGFASLTQAMARYQAHGAETLVICTGYGLVQITIDAEGNPVEHTLPCPDCVLSALAVLPAGNMIAEPAAVTRREPMLFVSAQRSAGPRFWPHTRAPPPLV